MLTLDGKDADGMEGGGTLGGKVIGSVLGGTTIFDLGVGGVVILT